MQHELPLIGKSGVEDLAVFGGIPTFSRPLHVGRPNHGDREAFLAAVEGILDRNWLTNNGPLVQEFERAICAKVGMRNCVAVSNGTCGLELLYRAVGLEGEVILPSFTFVATAHALQWQGITPVFCDIDPVSHQLAPESVEALITPRTTGVVGVHLWGEPAPVGPLAKLADRYGLVLVFDAAHAFGSSIGDRMVGTFGRAEVFSFHATKFVNAFEGGAVVTDDDALADRLRIMRNFGLSDVDQVTSIGINGKMPEVSAAMGLSTLDAMDTIVRANQTNYEIYADLLRDIPGLRFYRLGTRGRSNYQYVVIEVDETVTGLPRDVLVDVLGNEGVLARRYFHPGCHRMEPYRSSSPNTGRILPATESLSEKIVVIPNGPSIAALEATQICALIRFAVEQSEAIMTRLRSSVRGTSQDVT